MLAFASPKIVASISTLPTRDAPVGDPGVDAALIDSRPEQRSHAHTKVRGVVGDHQTAVDLDDIEVDDGCPPGMRPRAHVLTVRPHEVERGDFLVGLPRSLVAGVLYDGGCGRWLYTDDHGIVFASRKPWEQVQVVRDQPTVALRVRPLSLVRS